MPSPPEEFPPLETPILLWNGDITGVGTAEQVLRKGPWRPYSIEWRGSGYGRGSSDPMHWAPLPACDDPRWIQDYFCHTAPWEVSVLVRGDGWVGIDSRRYDAFPGFMGKMPPMHGTTAWMTLEAAKEHARAIPADYLALPREWDVQRKNRSEAIIRAAEEIELAVINDGETYRTKFLPLCEGKKIQYGQYKISFSMGTVNEEQVALLRGYVYRVVLAYAKKNDVLEDYNLLYDACHLAASSILAYYKNHSKEFV